ncbi:sporulation membrane protein YtaF [Ralstonia pickettii]|nr:sporulation membrane protein YtaF [Ralstonia pickettii]
MPNYTGILLLVIAVSIDGFGVGISYGIQKIKVPLLAILMIIFCSGLTVFMAMILGDMIKSFLSPVFSEKLGGVLLILLGIFTLQNIIRSNKKKEATVENATKLQDMKKVLRSPVQADLDRSGNISISEAAILGIALALDAFGAGIAASLLDYSAVITAILVAIMSGVFLIFGLRLGLLLAKYNDIQFFTYLPSLLLITIGVFNLIF